MHWLLDVEFKDDHLGNLSRSHMMPGFPSLSSI
jgi:hypothetical protein